MLSGIEAEMDTPKKPKWVTACPASDLSPGQVTVVELFGTDILLFRTNDGRTQAIHAWCPHMNNYIPNGLPPGKDIDHLLQDDQLICPFHSWQFNGKGLCTRISSGQRIPVQVSKAKPIIRYWQTREDGGFIQLMDETLAG